MVDDVRAAALRDGVEVSDGRGSPFTRIIERRPDRLEHDERYVRRRRRISVALSIATPAALLVAWQMAANSGAINTQFFPAPLHIWSTAVGMVRSGDLQKAVWVSTQRILYGFALGGIVGVIAGVVMAASWAIRAALDPLLSAFYTVPKLALLPMLLLIFGIGETPKILIIAVTVFFFMWISTMAAVASVDPRYLEALESFGASRRQVFFNVVVPASLPQIFVALRLSAGVSILTVVGVEFVEGGSGIGNLIWYSWSLFRADRMYVGIVVVALMGVLFTWVIHFAGKRAVPWDKDTGRFGGRF